MILQPLVENSIRHGIAPRRGAGTIKIEAAKQNGLLVLRVEDDGLGMKYGGVSAADNGIGLENTKTRLRHLYGEAHEFKLENRTSESGVSACIKLPFRESRKKYDGEDTHFNS
jgi:sensor histidine kinase YesM